MTEQEYAADEIDLRDYINVIIKRKKLILTIFLVSVVTAGIVSLLMPKVYEVTSVIQLGSANELLINKMEAKNIILSQNSLLPIIKELNLDIGVKSLRKSIKITDIKDTNLLEITIVCPNPDVGLKINNALSSYLIFQGQSIYQKRLALINERLKELDAEIKNTEENIDRTQSHIIKLPSSSGISQAEASLRIILLQNTIPNYESNFTSFRNQRNGLKLLLANAKDFKVFDPPIKPNSPIGPKKKQNVFISGIISLVFGMFLAFFLEFWQKGKEGEVK